MLLAVHLIAEITSISRPLTQLTSWYRCTVSDYSHNGCFSFRCPSSSVAVCIMCESTCHVPLSVGKSCWWLGATGSSGQILYIRGGVISELVPVCTLCEHAGAWLSETLLRSVTVADSLALRPLRRQQCVRQLAVGQVELQTEHLWGLILPPWASDCVDSTGDELMVCPGLKGGPGCLSHDQLGTAGLNWSELVAGLSGQNIPVELHDVLKVINLQQQRPLIFCFIIRSVNTIPGTLLLMLEQKAFI